VPGPSWERGLGVGWLMTQSLFERASAVVTCDDDSHASAMMIRSTPVMTGTRPR
jgi:hypothetical protein